MDNEGGAVKKVMVPPSPVSEKESSPHCDEPYTHPLHGPKV